jgi:hypothetical protein
LAQRKNGLWLGRNWHRERKNKNNGYECTAVHTLGEVAQGMVEFWAQPRRGWRGKRWRRQRRGDAAAKCGAETGEGWVGTHRRRWFWLWIPNDKNWIMNRTEQNRSATRPPEGGSEMPYFIFFCLPNPRTNDCLL